MIPVKGPDIAIYQRESGPDARRKVAFTIQRGQDDQCGVLHKIGVVELGRLLFAAHQPDRLFQLAISQQAESRDFQSRWFDFPGLLAASGNEPKQQDSGNEKPDQ